MDLRKLAAVAIGFLLLTSACSSSAETPAAPAPAESAATAPVETPASSPTTTTEAAATGALSARELITTLTDSWQHGDFAAMSSFAAPGAVAEAERIGPIAALQIVGGDACTTDGGRSGSCELTVDDGSGGFLWLYRAIIDEQGPGQSLRIAELIPTGDAG